MNSVPTKHFGIGIDTARYGHHVSFMDQNKRTAAKAFHFTESADGYQTFAKAIEAIRKKHSGCVLHIHVDAAGQYAENLLQWLHVQDWQAVISVGQPARNKAYRKAHYNKRKADPIESLACARFAVAERPPAMRQPPTEFSVLRERVSMSADLALLNWSSQSSRVTQRGPCPVHGSTSPKSTSFAVTPSKQVYLCHRCGSQGNALDLWAATQNLPLLDAGWDLIERLGIDAPLLEKKENCPA